ncbi:hypothetical protein MCERE19_01803 [Spirosomataceae bacterium]|jgi:hypothetical protein
MKAYLESILPKIASYSEKLDKLAYLVDEPWVVDSSDNFTKFIFKQDNTLLFSENGNVSFGKWELLNKASSILIQYNNTIKLYNHGFLDSAVLILKIDGGTEYFALMNQNKVLNLDLEKYLENNYNGTNSGTYSKVKNNFSTQSRKNINSNKGEITIIFNSLSDIPTVGDFVFIGSHNAPDDRYKIASMFYLYTKNGIIEKISMF